jgi:hypothetical protein
MGKPKEISVRRPNVDVQVRRYVEENGLEKFNVTMANGKQANFTKVDPETHNKLRGKAYTYVTP